MNHKKLNNKKDIEKLFRRNEREAVTHIVRTVCCNGELEDPDNIDLYGKDRYEGPPVYPDFDEFDSKPAEEEIPEAEDNSEDRKIDLPSPGWRGVCEPEGIYTPVWRNNKPRRLERIIFHGRVF